MYITTTGKLICPHCSGEKIVSNGAKKDLISFDLPAHGAPYYVATDRQRYLCISMQKKLCFRSWKGQTTGAMSVRGLLPISRKNRLTGHISQLLRKLNFQRAR